MSDFPPLKAQFSEAWDIYRRRLNVFIGVTLIALVLLFLCAILTFVAVKIVGPAGALVAFIGGVAALSWASGAFCVAIGSDQAGTLQCYGTARPRIGSLFVVGMLTALFTAGAYFLLFFPGLIMTVWLFFTGFICMTEGVGGLDCLLRSREYVRGRFWNVAGRLLAAWLSINLLQIIPVLGQILCLFMTPYPYIMSFLIYRDLKASRPDMPPPTQGAKVQLLALGFGGIVAIPLFFFFAFGSLKLMFASKMGQAAAQKAVASAVTAAAPSVPEIPLAAPSAPVSKVPPIPGVPVKGKPVSGKVHGRPFRLDRVTYNSLGWLELEQGSKFFPELGVTVCPSFQKSPLFGRAFRIPGDGTDRASFFVKWQEDPNAEITVPKQDTPSVGVSLTLEMGPVENGLVAGNISFKNPKDDTDISGAFTIQANGLLTYLSPVDPAGSETFHIFQRLVEVESAARKPGATLIKMGAMSANGTPSHGSGTGKAEAVYKTAGGAETTVPVEFVVDPAVGWKIAKFGGAAAAPTPAPAPKPVPLAAAETAPLPAAVEAEPEAVDDGAAERAKAEETMEACVNEIGILCHRAASNHDAATACLKKNPDGLMAPCKKALGLTESDDSR